MTLTSGDNWAENCLERAGIRRYPSKPIDFGLACCYLNSPVFHFLPPQPDGYPCPPPGTQPLTLAMLLSLDQFRGYTVAGMFLVNWQLYAAIGAFSTSNIGTRIVVMRTRLCPNSCWRWFRFRMSFMKRLKTRGFTCHWRIVRRILGPCW